jgi:hypothetical protein
MVLADVVECSGGLSIAQRGASGSGLAGALRVVPIGPVVVPGSIEPMEAQRVDHVVWRRHWAEAHRVVIEFVDVALVEVDDLSGGVTFDRVLPPDMEQHLLFDHILPLVLARNGQLVLHGGVVSWAGRGAVLVGSSGAGKSTLTAYLGLRGWTIGGDDGAVLVPTHPPTAEPTYATLRLTAVSADLLGLVPPAVGSAVAGKLRFAGSGDGGGLGVFRQEPVDLHLVALVEPELSGDTPTFEPLGGIAAHAELFGSTFHADFSRHSLLPAVIDGLAGVVERTTVGRLRVPRGLAGLAGAEQILRQLLDGDGDGR